VRVVLVDFGQRHRHTDKRAALHRSRPPADQPGKRVAGWTGKSSDTPDMHDLLRSSFMRVGRVDEDVMRMLRGCYEENGPVEFKLYRASTASRGKNRTTIAQIIAMNARRSLTRQCLITTHTHTHTHHTCGPGRPG